MSLLSTIGKVVVNPVDEEFKKAVQQSAMLASQLEISHTLLFNTIWNNKSATVEQILAKYGTDGKTLFEVSSLIQQILIKVKPTYKPLIPSKPITFLEDGTAIVTPSGVI